MRFMVCELCQDVVAPSIDYDFPRSCKCGVHSVWLQSVYANTGDAKLLCVFDKRPGAAAHVRDNGEPEYPRATILVIDDSVLSSPPSRDIPIRTKPGTNISGAVWAVRMPNGWII